ncbi:hypothetical protein GHT06_011030 [Daphnia sinensis]|uniref:C1q domain-containing protein n=1 Tax=Daphnia sinensis TaxID=1820382 RepID=A0AAD5PXG1_9CRUS|nr:hypothetical protein GHT06_011030 [Daphnia sinensis]
MARPSSVLIPIGILVLAWTTCSTAAALSLEDLFQQLQENNAAMKETQAEFEADLVELKAKDQQMSEIVESLVNEINELKEKVAGLEAQLQQQNPHSPVAIGSSDTSPTVFDESKHQPRSINGMPSSCGDLQMIGHTLNGLYSIVGLREVETVYCDFNKPVGDPGFQTRIGYQDLKTRPIYFYVQKTEPFSTENIPMPFERAMLNNGGAMNLETGIFTAPVTGTYFFSFTGLVQFEVTSTGILSELVIRLFRNNQEIARSQINEVNAVTNPNYLSPITLQSTLKLNATDEVWVEIDRGIVFGYLFDYSNTYCTNFNGWLLEEEILINWVVTGTIKHRTPSTCTSTCCEEDDKLWLIGGWEEMKNVFWHPNETNTRLLGLLGIVQCKVLCNGIVNGLSQEKMHLSISIALTTWPDPCHVINLEGDDSWWWCSAVTPPYSKERQVKKSELEELVAVSIVRQFGPVLLDVAVTVVSPAILLQLQKLGSGHRLHQLTFQRLTRHHPCTTANSKWRRTSLEPHRHLGTFVDVAH